MTVSTTTSRVEYAGNDSTVDFATGFYVIAAADLDVYLRDNTTGVATLQTKDVDYTVTLVGETNATVTFTTAPATGKTVVLVREPDAKQETDYVANDPFPAESHEKALDLLTMLVQALEDKTGRAVRIADGATDAFDGQFTPVASSVLVTDSTGLAMGNLTISDLALQAAALVSTLPETTNLVVTYGSGVVTIAVAGEETDTPLRLKLKGFGGFQLYADDLTPDAVAANAVDLQAKRSAATQTATGEYSGVGPGGAENAATVMFAGVGSGGQRNTAVAPHAGVGPGGYTNTASAAYAGVGPGGQENTASASHAGVGPGGHEHAVSSGGSWAGIGPGGRGHTISSSGAWAGIGPGGQANTVYTEWAGIGPGGQEHSASGSRAGIGPGGYRNRTSGASAGVGPGGENNCAYAHRAGICPGGEYNTASNQLSGVLPGSSYALAERYGECVRANGPFAAQGDCQSGEVILRCTTSADAVAELFANGVTGTERFTVPTDGDCFSYQVTVVGKTAGAVAGRAIYTGVVVREGTTVSDMVAPVELVAWADGGSMTNPTITMGADNTNKALFVKVDPNTATETRWLAHIRYQKINFT
jgi:hypothetical protein